MIRLLTRLFIGLITGHIFALIRYAFRRSTLLGFALVIAIILAFGGLFHLYTVEVLSQDKQDEVLIKAIPFVAVFVSIVLAFVYVIVSAATLLGGKVPQRTYRPIEGIIIAGILLGVVGLFQGWKLFTYEYGFLLLLISLLAFMVWSHVAPLPLGQSKALPPLSRSAHRAGLIAGFVIWIAVAILGSLAVKPSEPYGISPQIWNRMMDDEERQATADEAEDEYIQVKIPIMALFALMPAGLVYLAVRELVNQRERERERPHVVTSVSGSSTA
jgi:hypothetical protein